MKDDDWIVKWVAAVGLILAAAAFSCARQDEAAPKACEAICDAQGGRYEGYTFTKLIFIECFCIKRDN